MGIIERMKWERRVLRIVVINTMLYLDSLQYRLEQLILIRSRGGEFCKFTVGKYFTNSWVWTMENETRLINFHASKIEYEHEDLSTMLWIFYIADDNCESSVLSYYSNV